MELKEYQQNTLKRVKAYLEALKYWRVKNEKVVAAIGKSDALDVPLKAWEEIGGKNYRSRKNGIGEPLPNFCLKIPTGGGKTLLAAHTVDLVNRSYRQKQTGLVLWVMPTTQIYRQTIEHLRNRDHSYRQVLDIASGGRTVIYEKTDRFTPEDVAENLVVLTLMLPSASRQNKETLKVFKDSGGFGAFFPKDDDVQGHAKLLERFPNLDAFGDGKGLFQRQVKTSLGNTLRILSPIIILDEGHKAYSEMAQDTLRGLNPSVIVELGTLPDTDVARRLGCPAYVATFKRRSLKIPRARKPGSNANPWTPAEIKLLGTSPDEEVARRISRSVGAVIQRRELLHIPMQNPKLRDWTADEDGLLGTESDAEIARRLGRTLSATSHRRVRLKIPAWRPD
jgi:hypothetical protein